VETKEEKGMQITHWVTDKEVAFPSFIFGRFSSREDLYKSEKTGREIAVGVHATPLGRLRGTTKMKSVSDEAQTILKLYEEFFGPYPYERLDITQMAVGMGFGQAPPGLLFLTGEAFVSAGLAAELMSGSGRSPYFHDFFAHEMAHQWFGHEVLWGRDEDQWLSEAFAEYASAIYAEQIDGPKKFQEKLKRWRDNAQVGERSGFPIAGANYASAPSAAFAGDYRNKLIYDKGAYVVHMMRTLMGPDKFLEGMTAFLEAHSGGMATTQMLKADVEEVAGIPLDWFFDQWFYTAAIPTLKFSYSTQRSEDGSFILTGQIVQDGENWKQLVIPVYYDLGGAQPSIQRQAVSTADFTFKAKLPTEPKRVWLDEEGTVLANVVTDSKQ
jgi:aminopeptidase N